ncbi:MAG: fibronectin type III domain-containing protein [Desulfuromonadaceae bacterium]|nr:fibronectin type III domain-containing protein [Desulfuromonadaceae bacterium]
MNRYFRGTGVLLCGIFMLGCAVADGASKPVSATTLNEPVSSVQIQTPVPTGVRVNIATSGVHLSWHQPSGGEQATGYEIVRGTFQSGPFAQVATVDATRREYTDTSAAAEHIYFYKVRALTAQGATEYSVPAVAEMPGRIGY